MTPAELERAALDGSPMTELEAHLPTDPAPRAEAKRLIARGTARHKIGVRLALHRAAIKKHSTIALACIARAALDWDRRTVEQAAKPDIAHLTRALAEARAKITGEPLADLLATVAPLPAGFGLLGLLLGVKPRRGRKRK